MLQQGLELKKEYRVSKDMLAQTVGSGDLPVLATPTLIAKLENAAMQCVATSLDKTDTTVGGYIDLKHLRPTAEGEQYEVIAKLEEVSGKKLTFTLKATDEKGLIGEGKHIRFIVNRDKFISNL